MRNYNVNCCIILLFAFVFTTNIFAQFPPPAGEPGTNAIHADSNILMSWASSCEVERGFADISNEVLGYPTYGTSESGINKADNDVVSLGDNGIATLGFEVPIANGDGWDFVIFENSFSDDFLELAFVEVSSNAIDYYRFNSISLTQQTTQITTFGLIDATLINNLAGKYKGNFGVPFDLDELKDITLLDVNNIISIRIIDVVGSIDVNFATYDSEGNTINDPWPTPFETSGFDLDAVGVINNQDNTGQDDIYSRVTSYIYPNPANNVISLKGAVTCDKINFLSPQGKIIRTLVNPNMNNLDVSFLKSGYYLIVLYFPDKILSEKLIKN